MYPQVTKRFLKLLWGDRKGYANIRQIYEGKVKNDFWEWPFDDARWDAFSDNLVENTMIDQFMGVLLRTAMKGDADHVERETEWLWADVDIKKGVTFGGILSRVLMEPQIVVDSGHGWHLYWHLDKPVPIDLATGAMKVIAERLDGDSVGDPARIMRLPGTMNNKDGGLIPVRLLRLDPVGRHRFADFDMPENDRRPSPSEYDGDDWEVSDDSAPKFGEGERNSGLTRLAGAMLFKGMGDDEILDALRAENEVRCVPPVEDREVEQIVRSVRRYR